LVGFLHFNKIEALSRNHKPSTTIFSVHRFALF